MTALAPIQADRDAAATYWDAAGYPWFYASTKAGEADDSLLVQAFAAHRINTQKELAAHLETALDTLRIEGVCGEGCFSCACAREALSKYQDGGDA